jgi:hypothetical protein
MPSERTEKIRTRAYLIWEREGRPHGRAEQHWAQATHEIDNEEAAAAEVPSVRAEPADAKAGSKPSARAAPESPLERRR